MACFVCWRAARRFPKPIHEPQYHNPFPQLSRVAVIPFFNQSSQPTVDGFAIANAYRNELQKIPGFEVMPVGVVEQYLTARDKPLDQTTDFQRLARELNVDALVVGSITDFFEFYPPRMGLAVNWYAANPYFHPIPPGFGLPWDSAEGEFIPESLELEAEFAMAREQMKAQTPPIPPEPDAQKISPRVDSPPHAPRMESKPPAAANGEPAKHSARCHTRPTNRSSFTRPDDPCFRDYPSSGSRRGLKSVQ